jgi:hypothetical protein
MPCTALARQELLGHCNLLEQNDKYRAENFRKNYPGSHQKQSGKILFGITGLDLECHFDYTIVDNII